MANPLYQIQNSRPQPQLILPAGNVLANKPPRVWIGDARALHQHPHPPLRGGGGGQISLEHNPRNWQTGQTKELHLQASRLQGGHLKRNAALTVLPENAPPGRHHVRGALSFLRPALVEALVERESLLNL